MRQAYQTQPTLRENWLELDHAQELKMISEPSTVKVSPPLSTSTPVARFPSNRMRWT